MASIRRPMDKKHEYKPLTPSPLNPGSSRQPTPSPPSLPRRITIIEPARPHSKTPPKLPNRHRQLCESISPTERLLRHKAAAAWRSATIRRQIIQAASHSYGSSSGLGPEKGDERSPIRQLPYTTSPSIPQNHHQEHDGDYHMIVKIPDDMVEESPAVLCTDITKTIDTTTTTNTTNPPSWPTGEGGGIHVGGILPLWSETRPKPEPNKTRRTRSPSPATIAAAVEGIAFIFRHRRQGPLSSPCDYHQLVLTRDDDGSTTIQRGSVVVALLFGLYLLRVVVFAACRVASGVTEI